MIGREHWMEDLKQEMKRRRAYEQEVRELSEEVMEALFDGLFATFTTVDKDTVLYGECLNMASAIAAYRLDQAKGDK